MSAHRFRHQIGLDVRMLSCTGIGSYLAGLLGGFAATGAFGAKDFCLCGPNAETAVWRDVAKKSFTAPIYSLREQIEYPSVAAGCRLWHSPHYNIPLVRPAGMKLVTTIHDLIHWIYRKQFFSPLQGFYAGQMLRRSVRDSDQILTVSEQTRRDLVTHFRADPEKISVIPEGVGARFTQGDRRGAGERMKSRYAIPGDYFLYVGLLKPHKNVLWLFDLFKRLRGEGKIRSSLVLVGRKNERYPAGYERYSEIESGHGIIYHSGVDSNDLVELYRGALALVHPSLYEGFGLTLLEAMACGTPVAAFRAASIPEVCADAACLVSPGSEEEMTRALERLENEPSLREELSRKGLLRAGQFRWEETAAKTIRVYEKVLR